MPELPEVETVRRALAPVLEQHHVTAAFVGRDDLRWSLPENLAARLIGRRFTRVDRRGKYVLMHFGSTRYFVAASWHVRVYSYL